MHDPEQNRAPGQQIAAAQRQVSHLISAGQVQEARELAETSYSRLATSPIGLLAAEWLLLCTRCAAGDFAAAGAAGEAVVRIAPNLGAWDHFGRACLWLGKALQALGQPDAALKWWTAYLEHRPRYNTVQADEAEVWHGIGSVYLNRGDGERALAATRDGLAVAAGQPEWQVRFHLLAALAAEQRGEPRAAMEHGLGAQVAAMRSGRLDLETTAGEVVYRLARYC